MFFGALSTDIKKSSTIWANLPIWMQEAVKRTNNITEYVIKTTKKDGVKQTILPNAPEGDAWTVLYECDDQETLKQHVKHVAHLLKHIYSLAREKNILKTTNEEIKFDLNKKNLGVDERKTTKEFLCNKETPFFRAIYVRIGVAFSNIAPIEYTYYAKTKEKESREWGYTSYWQSVIKESERAEEQAPWENGIGVTQAGEVVKAIRATPEEKTFTAFKGKKTFKVEEYALKHDVYKQNKYTVEAVDGFMVFVHYHLHIQFEDVRKNPHLFKPLVHEFETVHNQTVRTFNDVFEHNVYLVKVKRSSDSMFFIEPSIKPSQVWNHCLSICASLPVGSSIGIAFTNSDFMGQWKGSGIYYSGKKTGTLNKLTSVETNRYDVHKVDYFGDCVNLSARMDTFDWKYPTKLFTTGTNSHMSRVAMCCADTKTPGWVDWFKQSKNGTSQNFPGGTRAKYIRPFQVEDIPRPYLNAGKEDEVLRVISAHVYLNSVVQPGDVVWWNIEEKKKNEANERKPIRKGSKAQIFFDPNTKKKTKYYGRVLSVDFLFVRLQKITGKAWPEEEEDVISLNITYINKCPQEELKPEAEKLKKEDEEKVHINNQFRSLKF